MKPIGRYTIMSLTPAQGWVAVFEDDVTGESCEVVACWALVSLANDDPGSRAVVGMVPIECMLWAAEEAENFVRYEYRGDAAKTEPELKQ